MLFSPGNLDIISTGPLYIWHSCVSLRWQLEEFQHFLRGGELEVGGDFMKMFSFTALCLVRLAVQVPASVYGGIWKNFPLFLREGGLWFPRGKWTSDPEVDSRCVHGGASAAHERVREPRVFLGPCTQVQGWVTRYGTQ